MTPTRKQVFVSSLGLCTAYWLFPAEGSAALATMIQPEEDNNGVREHIVEEALYRYYNPLASLEEVKPLKQSKKPLKYKIKSGDTLSEIAKQYDLSTEQLAVFNRIGNADVIQTGKTIKIPYRSKEIRIGEEQDLKAVAKKYNVSKTLLEKLNPELKQTDGEMYIGQVVTIPERMKVTQPKPNKKVPAQKQDSIQLASRSVKTEKQTATASTGKQTAQFSGHFSWPVGGQITSQYGMRGGRLHRGIDIWNAEEGHTPIKAAASGVVTRAGYDGNYGNLIVIDHGGGWSTYYAHLRVIQVSKGQTVASGAQIGYMGQSGNATGYHLHFEVRENGENMNPLNILP